MPATAAYSAAKGALGTVGRSPWQARSLRSASGVTILVTGTYDTDIITERARRTCAT